MAKEKTESTPIFDNVAQHLVDAYGTKCHAESAQGMDEGLPSVIVDYEPLKLSTYRIFFALQGSMLQDSVLWVEQAIITLIFVGAAVPIYIYFNRESMASNFGAAPGESMRKYLDSQESRMREFAMIMTTLASLLLSFYTAMAVGRWWVIRTVGVGGIRAAAMELEMLLSQLVTQDAFVLQAIRRYARASLILVFLWRRKRLADLKHELVEVHQVLDEQEVDQLVKGNNHPCLHETIWAWQSAIVCALYHEGKIKSDTLLRSLLQKCSDGRKGVQCIHTHLAVKIPMQYVHLLGLLVKMHNFVCAFIMGALFGSAVRSGEIIICCQLAARCIMLPLLFNAILLINAELADPFDGHATDFPGGVYSKGIEKAGLAFVKAGQNMPDWMARRNRLRLLDPPV